MIQHSYSQSKTKGGKKKSEKLTKKVQQYRDSRLR